MSYMFYEKKNSLEITRESLLSTLSLCALIILMLLLFHFLIYLFVYLFWFLKTGFSSVALSVLEITL